MFTAYNLDSTTWAQVTFTACVPVCTHGAAVDARHGLQLWGLRIGPVPSQTGAGWAQRRRECGAWEGRDALGRKANFWLLLVATSECADD